MYLDHLYVGTWEEDEEQLPRGGEVTWLEAPEIKFLAVLFGGTQNVAGPVPAGLRTSKHLHGVGTFVKTNDILAKSFSAFP